MHTATQVIEPSIDISLTRPLPETSGQKPNVLFVTHRTPFPPDKGDRIRTFNVLRYLARLAHVDLATLADEEVDDESRVKLEGLARTVEVAPIERRLRWVRAVASLIRGRSATEGLFASPQLRRRIERMTSVNDYDLIVVVCSGMIQYLKWATIGRAKVFVDLIDVDSEKWRDYAASSTGWRRLAYGVEAKRVRRLESRLAEQEIPMAVVSEDEVKCLRAFQPHARIAAIRNGVDFDYFHADNAEVVEANSCAFVGALDYKPNIDGTTWFCEAVWPRVRDRNPDACFTIVGRRPVEAVRRLNSLPGVQVIADVPDIRPYLRRASVIVAPLRIARGVQNKVLEALSMGKTVVATGRSIEGLNVVIGQHLYHAETPAEWAHALQVLWDDEGERQRLGAAARAYVCDNHSWSQCLQPLGEMLRQATAMEKAAAS